MGRFNRVGWGGCVLLPWLVTALMVALSAGEVGAAFRFQRAKPEYAVGLVRKTERNTIYMYDERDREVKRFIYVGDLAPFQEGVRVRIHYVPGSDRARHVQILTPESKATGNGGYIFRRRD